MYKRFTNRKNISNNTRTVLPAAVRPVVVIAAAVVVVNRLHIARLMHDIRYSAHIHTDLTTSLTDTSTLLLCTFTSLLHNTRHTQTNRHTYLATLHIHLTTSQHQTHRHTYLATLHIRLTTSPDTQTHIPCYSAHSPHYFTTPDTKTSLLCTLAHGRLS